MSHRALTLPALALLTLASQACSGSGNRAASTYYAGSSGGYATTASTGSSSDSAPTSVASAPERSESYSGGGAAPMSAPMQPQAASVTRSASVSAHGGASAPVRTSATTPSTTAPRGSEGSSASVQQQAAPMLIYTAQIGMVVDHVPTTIDRIIESVTAEGGFLQTRTDTSVTVRVPVGRFRESLGRVETVGTVETRSVDAQDITEQFHDLEVSLTNLRAVQTRLQQFLARATNVAEALAVEHELERVGGQIDQIEGRIRFLSQRAAFSTITVTLRARPVVSTVTEAPPTAGPLPEMNLPIEVLDQLGLSRLLRTR